MASNTTSKKSPPEKPGLAPAARLPVALLYATWLAGPQVVLWFDLPGKWVNIGVYAVALLLGFVIYRMQRQWTIAQGYPWRGIWKSTAPEVWIGVGVLGVTLLVVQWLDLGPNAGVILLGVAIMVIMVLVVIAGVRRPKRQAAAKEAERDEWSQPFD